MKKLPKIYKNNYNKIVNNNKKIEYIRNNNLSSNNKKQVLDEIFNGIGKPYNKKVIIKRNNNMIETYIVSRDNKDILTLDNEIIPIDEIDYIEIKN